ncbi:NUDIX domain-containing protein [Candidatus Saccharibacteria bacterium]|nr:NUDIX domain-containing protein [Candidatus Saccharibacteria bacterium]
MGDKKPCQHFNQVALPKKDGKLEGGACVWLIKREAGQTYILFQKRAENIENGGFYDASAGGHIDEGEDPLTAALRETKEEIGLKLKPDELKYVCSYTTDKKLIYVYLSDRTRKNDELKLCEDEVESVEWVSLDDLDVFTRACVKPPLRYIMPHLPVLRFHIENYL